MAYCTTELGAFLCGDEGYAFDPAIGLITEIRASCASRGDGRAPIELVGFDHGTRGYHLSCTVPRLSNDSKEISA
jgi:hypothetical protein